MLSKFLPASTFSDRWQVSETGWRSGIDVYNRLWRRNRVTLPSLRHLIVKAKHFLRSKILYSTHIWSRLYEGGKKKKKGKRKRKKRKQIYLYKKEKEKKNTNHLRKQVCLLVHNYKSLGLLRMRDWSRSKEHTTPPPCTFVGYRGRPSWPSLYVLLHDQ